MEKTDGDGGHGPKITCIADAMAVLDCLEKSLLECLPALNSLLIFFESQGFVELSSYTRVALQQVNDLSGDRMIHSVHNIRERLESKDSSS